MKYTFTTEQYTDQPLTADSTIGWLAEILAKAISDWLETI